MFSLAQLTQEIEAVIAESNSAATSRLQPEWITQQVVARHPDFHGEDADFWRVVGRAEVRDQVRQRLNRYKLAPAVEPDTQLVLAGFERLQQRYIVEEDGELVAIRVQDMTRGQRQAKAQELRAMGAGCYQHADELERFDAQAEEAA